MGDESVFCDLNSIKVDFDCFARFVDLLLIIIAERVRMGAQPNYKRD